MEMGYSACCGFVVQVVQWRLGLCVCLFVCMSAFLCVCLFVSEGSFDIPAYRTKERLQQAQDVRSSAGKCSNAQHT